MKTTKTTENVALLTKLKARHAVKYSKDFPNRKPNILDIYANVDDVTIKRAPANTLEGFANRLITDAERAEQEAIRANPPVFCKGYVERADYSITSLYSDYKDKIEDSTLLFMLRLQIFGVEAWNTLDQLVTWDDYRVERKKWRSCKYMFCLNVYPIDKTNFKDMPAKRNDSRFCCDECRTAARDADRRYKETGSYLPESYYVPRLTESVGDDIRKYEYAAEAKTIQRNINANRPVRRAVIKEVKPKHGAVITYKSIEEAEKAYADSDRAGRIKIN
ncbi:hypothetical protein [Lederbergia citri]|uniref:Uncharacterized protein n=1 Tax=Lederbergia citri TaxID=2833580 RepID=A0A942T9C1_9BACI|nr:hypothetical protein [Lederbergia citri]MBS4193485.1 hypothetical protein [Lederbergia citri]